MVKRIRMAAGVICLTAYLCGCSPDHENANVAPADGKMASSDAGYQSRGQAPVSLEERDIQRVTQTASPEPEKKRICLESVRERSFRAYPCAIRI
ncbi:MAG: hypothetical protein LUK37_13255 [Clostridia bacterium]|nr:hypothetical protein [Clostridia bacterium]